ncbi:hypothetical protein [Streptomyces sp. NPDC096934]|uniref:hypothetical protein n=1 Tax=Streptomyces sp. NPDC096934 TaxID=3155551 RepID=UPI0033235037
MTNRTSRDHAEAPDGTLPPIGRIAAEKLHCGTTRITDIVKAVPALQLTPST